MRVFLSICVLVATTVAHPCCPSESCPPPSCPQPPQPPCGQPPCGQSPCGQPPQPPQPPCGQPPQSPCDSSSSDDSYTSESSTTVSISTTTRFVCDKSVYPSPVPLEWNIMMFDTQAATQAFQNIWYLQMTTPTSLIDGVTASHAGLFHTGWPCSNTRICFQDTTPECDLDWNTDFYMLDLSFNVVTQCMEKTLAVLRAACGPDSSLAIFDVCTQTYYPSPLQELQAIIDEQLYKRPCDDIYKRDYTICVIGADDCWAEYMVIVIVNKYNNLVCGNDQHIIWVLTRDEVPSSETYQKAFDDIIASNLSPFYLVCTDQSIVLKDISTISPEDLSETIDTSVITSLTSTTTTSSSGSTTTSTTTVNTTTTVESTVDFVLQPDYPSPYELETYSYCNSIKIIKYLSPEIIKEALCGKWYANLATPCLLSTPFKSIGLLNTAFPASCIQILIDDSISSPWTCTSTAMMLERGYNAITGDVSVTRSIIASAFDDNSPACSFWVYTEGCYTDTVNYVTPTIPDGIVFQLPGKIYTAGYLVCIVGYLANKYLILYIPNQFNNLFYADNDTGVLIVLTRDRIICPDIVDAINQDILLSGYNIQYIMSIDQTIDITEDFTFETSYFDYSYTSVSTTVESSSMAKSCMSVTETSSGSDDSCTC